MNDNNTYIVKCTSENFDEVKYLVQMFGRIIEVDDLKCSIRTFSLDSTMKQRLGDIGASFWQESGYTAARSVMSRKL